MSQITDSEKGESSNLKLENSIVISVLSSNVKNYVQEIKCKTHQTVRKKKYCFLCRSQSNSLLLILGTYVTIFSIASIILIVSVLKLQNVDETEKGNSYSRTSEEIYKMKHNSYVKQADRKFPQKLFQEFLWPFKSSAFNCSNLSLVKQFNYLTSGWTKNVFSFEFKGKSYALKTVNMNGVDMSSCKENQTAEFCFEKASFKMYREYILSKELSHSNIIKVLAWCVSHSDFSYNVAVVTELCSPIDIVTLLRMSFQKRLKIMLDLSHLIAYLASSPLGSVAINDYQRQQFVLCGDTLRLTDLDDLSIEEPRCMNSIQCSKMKSFQDLTQNETVTHEKQIDCVNNLCVGYNERRNVYNTYKHFVSLFLNISTPVRLKEDVESFLNSYTSWSAKTVLKETELLHVKYESLKNNYVLPINVGGK